MFVSVKHGRTERERKGYYYVYCNFTLKIALPTIHKEWKIIFVELHVVKQYTGNWL